MPAQVGGHDAVPIAQRVGLGCPGVVVECCAVQEDDGRALGSAAPVPDRRVGAYEMVSAERSHGCLLVGSVPAGQR